ncbi:MAG TPA: hypothetical protein VD908_08575, partial [Cytophagales bacterium]|nr:hypothetical protein [Cytophagales bacterium]
MNFLPFAKAFLLMFFLAYSLKAERVGQKVLADTIEIPDKIYITIDKSYYSVTETIFFKVYQLNAQNFKPHDLSRVVYVNLLNENNQTIFSKKVKIEEGCSSGEIYLPDSLKGGVYKIVGFNNWMRNFDKA